MMAVLIILAELLCPTLEDSEQSHLLTQELFESVTSIENGFTDTEEYRFWINSDARVLMADALDAVPDDELDEYLGECADRLFEGNSHDRMRWLAACSWMFLLDGRSVRLPDRPSRQATLELGAKRAVVMRCIEDADYLRQYAQLVAWRRTYLGFPHGCDVFFSRGRDYVEDYKEGEWGMALEIVLLVYFTSRDDLLDNRGPEELGEVISEWWPWFQENGQHLVPATDRCGWVIADDPDAATNPLYSKSHELPEPNWPMYPFDNWENERDPVDPPHLHPLR